MSADTLKTFTKLCARNESGKKGLKIVFEISKTTNSNQVLNQLFKHTDFQKAFSVNQVALVDKVPTLLNWKDCIDIYINKNKEVIIKEAQYDNLN